MALGAGGQIKTLSDTISTLKGSVAGAAREVAHGAKEANMRTTLANTNARAAKNAVNSIYTKNSSLKR